VVEFRLLGPVTVRAGDEQVDAGLPRQRAVLAALLVDAGRLVTLETLIDRVWGERPPAKARDALYSYVARIRRLLTRVEQVDGTRVVLVRHTGGYLLDVPPASIDRLRFTDLTHRARTADRAASDRAADLAAALALWQGEPLAGTPGAWAARTRQSWTEERIEAATEWADLQLATGRPDTALPVIRPLVAEHPLAERPVAVLMRALTAADRPAEALAAFADARRRLGDELGAEPGPELRRLHESVLRGELAGGGPAAEDTGPPPAGRWRTDGPAPAQLPANVTGFTGRTAELAALDALLDRPADVPAVVVTAVAGTAGVGKTALAVRWAHRVAPRFPDGQLYVNLRGFDPGGQVVSPANAVRGFLDALGVPAERIPAGLDAQTALYRSLLAGRRILVVLDNARDADHARPLLPGSPTALAIVTSRNPLTPLIAEGAHPLTLDLLTTADSRALLARRTDPDRVAAEPDAVEEIISSCARLPLALALVAARAATHPTFPLAALATELATAGDQPGHPDTGDVLGQVRAVFSWSYTTLTPAAARLFRLLGLHPGPDATAPAAAGLTAASPADTRRSLAELTRAGLLTEHAPGRYGCHDLLHAYATDLTQTVDSDAERRAATARLLDHYVHTAHTAERLLDPGGDPIQIPLARPAPGTAPEQLGDLPAALAWLTAEHQVLLAVQRVAARTGFDTSTWQLAWALDTFLSRRAQWPDQAGTWQTALAAADHLSSRTATAYAHCRIALAASLLGDYDQALHQLNRGLDLYTEARDLAGQARTQHGLAILWELQDRFGPALEHAERALVLYRAAGDPRGQAIALNGIGWNHALLGRHAQALAPCEQARTLFQQAGDPEGEAVTWDSLGYAHHHLGHHTDAAGCYQHALTLYRDLGDRYQEAVTLTRLGDAHSATGRPDAAHTAWTEALTILTDLRHSDVDAVRAKLAQPQQLSPPIAAASPPVGALGGTGERH